jgi:hypothetical protein
MVYCNKVKDAVPRNSDCGNRAVGKEDELMTIKKVTKKMAVTCKCKSSC